MCDSWYNSSGIDNLFASLRSLLYSFLSSGWAWLQLDINCTASQCVCRFLCKVTWSQSALLLADIGGIQSHRAEAFLQDQSGFILQVRFLINHSITDHYTNQQMLTAVLLSGWLMSWLIKNWHCQRYWLWNLYWCVFSVRLEAMWRWTLTSGSTSQSMPRRRSGSWWRGLMRPVTRDWWSAHSLFRSQVTL